MNIEITQSARERMIELLLDQQENHIRTFVQGGGCAGFSYGFAFDRESQEDDFHINLDENKILLVDSMSAQYLQGAVIDYVQELVGAQFVIRNPNAQSTCGCGSSFSV